MAVHVDSSIAGGQRANGDVVMSARGLTRNFGAFRAVDNVDLDVHTGTIHALVDPNGAGKTTILNLLGGQLLPTAGEINKENKTIASIRPDARARAGIG